MKHTATYLVDLSCSNSFASILARIKHTEREEEREGGGLTNKEAF